MRPEAVRRVDVTNVAASVLEALLAAFEGVWEQVYARLVRSVRAIRPAVAMRRQWALTTRVPTWTSKPLAAKPVARMATSPKSAAAKRAAC